MLFLQNSGRIHLIGPPELTDFTLQLLHPGPFVGAQPRPTSAVALGQAHPVTQRLRGAADLLRHRPDRRPLRVMLLFVIEHQPDGSLPHLG